MTYLLRILATPGVTCTAPYEYFECKDICDDCIDLQVRLHSVTSHLHYDQNSARVHSKTCGCLLSDLQSRPYFCRDMCEAGCTCPTDQFESGFGSCVRQDACTCFDSYEADAALAYKMPGDISRRGCVDW